MASIFSQLTHKTTVKDLENQLLQLVERDQDRLINTYIQVFLSLTTNDIMTEGKDVVLWNCDEDTTDLFHAIPKRFQQILYVLLYLGQQDNIIGYLNSTELLSLLSTRDIIPLKTYKKDVLFVSQWMDVLSLYLLFQEKDDALAVVVNEHGGMEGVVTKIQLFDAFMHLMRQGLQSDKKLDFLIKFDHKTFFTTGSLSMYTFQKTVGKKFPTSNEKTLHDWLQASEGVIHPMEYLSFQDLGFHIKILKMAGDTVQLLRVEHS